MRAPRIPLVPSSINSLRGLPLVGSKEEKLRKIYSMGPKILHFWSLLEVFAEIPSTDLGRFGVQAHVF